MEVDIRRGKYPGDWTMKFDTDGWSATARDIHTGMVRAMQRPLSDLLSWFAPTANDPGQILDVLNESVAAAQVRLDMGTELTVPDPENMTYADAVELLKEYLRLSHWHFASAQESLAKDRLSVAVRAFGVATHLYGSFQAQWEQLKAEYENSDPSPSGPAYALANRSDQKLKPGWIAHCKAAVATGREIRQLDDLLNVAGYDPTVTSITPRTLKRWAGEAGITLSPGRRKCA